MRVNSTIFVMTIPIQANCKMPVKCEQKYVYPVLTDYFQALYNFPAIPLLCKSI